MNYLIRNGKKLYFPLEWNKEQVIEYYRTIMAEQDEESPHRYLTEDLEEAVYDTVIDMQCRRKFCARYAGTCETYYCF